MDKYDKIRVVGRGAYGTVYLCRNLETDQEVIIKQIPMEDMTIEERQTALNEVKVLSMLKHPHIIAYYENFFEGQALMIVMEYAQGGTIFQYLAERKGVLVDEDEILKLFVQMLIALQHVHQNNILHRDLKPPNILLNRRRKVVKIGDFGISKILTSKSKASTVLGSPCYISPELCEGRPYNQKSDIWALGCVLYELATLRRAFEAPNLPALVMKIMNRSLQVPIPGRYSQELKQLIMSLLSVDPSQRPHVNEIMALPIVMNALMDNATEIGRIPCTRVPKLLAGISAAVPPSRPRGGGAVGMPSRVKRTESENSATFLDPFDSSYRPSDPLSVVYCWGSGVTTPTMLPLPVHDSDVVQVAVGRTQRTGVTSNGKPIIWESPPVNSGSLGIPRFLEGQSGVTIIQVSCGDMFTACLTDRGILMTFGSGANGCLGHGNFNDVRQAKVVEDLLGFELQHVSCGASHVMAVTADREVFSWGRGDNGRLGLSSHETFTMPQAVILEPEHKPSTVHCGTDCSIILTVDNRVLVCGSNRCNKLALEYCFDNNKGKLSHAEDVDRFTPLVSQPLPRIPIKDVSLGTSHTAFVSVDGHCWTIGSNSFGQLGYQRDISSRSPQLVTALKDKRICHVSCGDTFTAVVTEDNKLFTWGKGSRGRLGHGNELDCSSPKQVDFDKKLKVLSLSSSHGNTLMACKVLEDI